MGRRCPICGRSEDKVLFIGGLCADCFAKKKMKSEYTFTLNYCPICGRIKIYGRWVEGKEENVKRYILEKIESSLSKILPRYGVSYYVEVEGEEARIILAKEKKAHTLNVPIKVNFKPETCDECRKKITGYHDAIIQFRGDKGKLTQSQRKILMERIEKLPVDLRKTIISIKEVREGIDAEIYGQATAKMIASKITSGMMADTRTSYKTVSVKNGVKRTRMTLSVRFYEYKANDIVLYKGKPAVILGEEKGRLKIMEIPTRRTYKVSLKDARASIREYRDQLTDAMIVAVAPEKVYIMRLDNYETEAIDPESILGVVKEGVSGKLLYYNERFYFVTYD